MGQDDFSEQLDEIKKVIENNNNNFITNESLDTKLKEFAKSLKQEERDEADPNSIKDTEGKSFVSKLTDKDAMYVSAIQELKREIDELKLKIGE